MIVFMPGNAPASKDLEAAIARFRAGSSSTAGEGLLLPNWRPEDWEQAFRFTSIRKVSAGEALIRSGEPDRTLYFVLHGVLEVILRSSDGLSMGRVAVVGAGSVLGELRRFLTAVPGRPAPGRSRNAKLTVMRPDQFGHFWSKSSPALARELLFALGRISRGQAAPHQRKNRTLKSCRNALVATQMPGANGRA